MSITPLFHSLFSVPSYFVVIFLFYTFVTEIPIPIECWSVVLYFVLFFISFPYVLFFSSYIILSFVAYSLQKIVNPIADKNDNVDASFLKGARGRLKKRITSANHSMTNQCIGAVSNSLIIICGLTIDLR